jgi:2-polyprenyl-3-methyl-5-hydroxy-6-metoxy-1,4-benzoquinol methylase
VPKGDVTRARDEEQDVYGKRYWFEYQEEVLGLQNILRRARQDLTERALSLLHTLLLYRPSGGRLLDLGSGHGGLVALARWAGFDATGLELSPWVVDFARQAFGVPMLCGPLEDQRLEPHSLDVVVLADVLEHLPDPVGTMRRCLELLRDDGILLVETPRVPAPKGHGEAAEGGSAWRRALQEKEHLFLFSESSLQAFFRGLGCEHQVLLPASCPAEDMRLLACRRPLTASTREAILAALERTASGRMVLALVDSQARFRVLQEQVGRARQETGAYQRAFQNVQQELNQALAEGERARGELQRAQGELQRAQGELQRAHTWARELASSRWRALGRKLRLVKPTSFERQDIPARGLCRKLWRLVFPLNGRKQAT